ncbi:unnamed protein product [Closterium sp. NIES-64]|nr:unnamed protein product [Closterium sp. NIES-64]
MADSSVHSRPMAAQGAEDGEEDLEDVENTDPDYAQDRENDSEFEATEEDLFQGGIYEPSVRIQVQGSEEESEGPGGDGVRPRPGAPEERYEEDGDHSDAEEEGESSPGRRRPPDSASHVEQAVAPGNAQRQTDVAEKESRIRRSTIPHRLIEAGTRRHYCFHFLHFKWWVIIFMATMVDVPVADSLAPSLHDEVEEWNVAQTDPLKRHYAGARFLDTLASIGRLVVAQDLAMMWAFCHQHGVRNPRCNCERHPYVQMSPLCNHPLFQKWAYLVGISHFQGEKLRATGQTTAKADAIFRTTAEEKLHKMHLTANMLREELGILRGREMQLAMENAKLREKLTAEREDKARVIAEFEAYKRSVAARDDAANTSAEIDGSSKSAGTGGNQATDASKAPVAVQEFFVVVVVSWREATTVAAAWKVWVQPSLIMGGRSLREVFAEFDRYKNKDKNSSFITAYSRFAVKGTPGMAVGACERKMRRVHRVIVSVETLRKDSSEAATATAIKLLDEVLLVCNFTEFTNGLAVLHETPTIKKQKTGSSTEKRTVNDLAQRRVGWLLVKKGLRDQRWATSLFGDDEWEEIHKEEMAQEKAEEEKQRTAAAKKAEREQAKGEASKRKEQK